MSAKILKIGDSDTTPELLLDMVKANIPNIQNVVVSVVFKNDKDQECQTTYSSRATMADLAYHALCINDYLTNIVVGDD